MPLYEYECEACGHRFERIQKFSDPLVSSCPSCAGKVRKLFSSPAIQFKGTGWYVTDYAKKPGAGKAAGSSDSDGGGDGTSAKADSDTKTAASKKGDGAATTSSSESTSTGAGKTGDASPASATKSK